MNKPNQLRAALVAAIPELGRNPEQLLVFVRKGDIASASINSLSFEYQMTIELLITDLSAHVTAVIVPILAWCQSHQPELFDLWHRTGKGISFEAEILDDKKVDLMVTLDVTERVLVRSDANGDHVVTHLGEPPSPDPLGPFESTLGSVFAGESDLTNG